jgi:SAM-dependent methyltransferase
MGARVASRAAAKQSYMNPLNSNHSLALLYNIDPHIAELYDQQETYRDDVDLIQQLIGPHDQRRILEPFCGTGRILIPLALAGHEIVGLDCSAAMLARARSKIAQLPPPVQQRITLVNAHAVRDPWPSDFDVVILGGNCFYELATAEEQQTCLAAAAAALRTGGFVYVDNSHMEGDLDPAWQSAQPQPSFPTGTCADGTVLASTLETIWSDAPQRLARFRRVTKITSPAGHMQQIESIQQKHPVSTGEVASWLKENGFIIEQHYGDRAGTPYQLASNRAIFWARKPEWHHRQSTI